MAFDTELGYDPDYCHCGEPVLAITKPEGYQYYNSGLIAGYCEHCATTRCDAYPGECGRKSVVHPGLVSR